MPTKKVKRDKIFPRSPSGENGIQGEGQGICSYPTRNVKFQKNSKKCEKVKKHHYSLISDQNRLEKDEKEGK